MEAVSRLQIVVEAVAALLEAVDLIEAVGLLAGHAGVEDQGLAAAGLGQLLGVVHELHAAALAALVFVGDDAGDVAGHAGEPEGVEVGPVAEAVVGVAVHEEEGEAVLIGQHVGVDLADHVFVIGVVVPEFFDVVEGDVEVGHRCGFEFHTHSSSFIVWNTHKLIIKPISLLVNSYGERNRQKPEKCRRGAVCQE